MAAIALVLLAVGTQSAEGDAADLVARLGSARSSEREAAAEALTGLGEGARAALRAGRDSRDLVVRMGAARLLDELDGRALVAGTPVTLDFRDRPISEIVATLGDRLGTALVLLNEADPRWAERIDLLAPEPVPFWDAIDRLGRAADLRPMMGEEARQFLHGSRVGPPQELRRAYRAGSPLLLVAAEGGERPPKVTSGAIQVVLLSLVLHRERSFGAGGPGQGPRPMTRQKQVILPDPRLEDGPSLVMPITREERVILKAQVRAEPRLTLVEVEGAEAIEILDDRGRSLRPEPDDQSPAANPVRMSGGFGLSGETLTIPLRIPPESGRTIRVIRGKLRILVSGPAPDPLVVRLEGSEGKIFRDDDATLVIHEIRQDDDPRKGMRVDLTLDVFGGVGRWPWESGSPSSYPGPPRPPSAQPQLVFGDAKGRVCGAFPLASYGTGNGTRTTLHLAPTDEAGPPAEVRYHALRWATVDVPFEFRDIPMP
jgi:hypothetical protein